MNVANIMMGGQRTPIQQVSPAIQSLVRQGASVSQSHAIHLACAANDFEMVQLLLQLEPAARDGYDHHNMTPLMIAAETAGGRSTNTGIDDTRVVDLLLACGADKNLENNEGLTAYGIYNRKRKEYSTMLQAMIGMPVAPLPASEWSDRPTERALQAKLIPPNGPSANDLAGGRRDAGLVDYAQEDLEEARLHGDMDDGDY